MAGNLALTGSRANDQASVMLDTTSVMHVFLDSFVLNTCSGVGWNGNGGAFSRAFKKVVGVPPSAWRRRPGQDGARPITHISGEFRSG